MKKRWVTASVLGNGNGVYHVVFQQPRSLGGGFRVFGRFDIVRFTTSADARTQTMVVTYSCYALDDAKKLANHQIENGWIGFDEFFETLKAEGICIQVVVSVPTPNPLVQSFHSENFDVGVFRTPSKTSKNGIEFALLLGKFTPYSGA